MRGLHHCRTAAELALPQNKDFTTFRRSLPPDAHVMVAKNTLMGVAAGAYSSAQGADRSHGADSAFGCCAQTRWTAGRTSRGLLRCAACPLVLRPATWSVAKLSWHDVQLDNAWVFSGEEGVGDTVKAYLALEKKLLSYLSPDKRKTVKPTDVSGVGRCCTQASSC